MNDAIIITKEGYDQEWLALNVEIIGDGIYCDYSIDLKADKDSEYEHTRRHLLSTKSQTKSIYWIIK